MVTNLKAAALHSLDRADEALAALDGLLRRVGNVHAPELIDPLAGTLLMKSQFLDECGREQEAKATRGEILRRFRGEPGTLAKQAVAGALVSNALELEAAGRLEGALAAVNEFLGSFSGSVDPAVRKNELGMLVTKPVLLARLARGREAVESADQAHARMSGARDEQAEKLAPLALAAGGFARLVLGKQLWQGGDEAGARRWLEAADERLREAVEKGPEHASSMATAAYVAFLLGEKDRARGLMAQALTRGGDKIREAALKESSIYPLPQDEGFRELVRSIPGAPPS
jgi:hypothetical protein